MTSILDRVPLHLRPKPPQAGVGGSEERENTMKKFFTAAADPAASAAAQGDVWQCGSNASIDLALKELEKRMGPAGNLWHAHNFTALTAIKRPTKLEPSADDEGAAPPAKEGAEAAPAEEDSDDDWV
eukprot:CAMPEP_0204575340 /NCGR_PEP_ID=MMETSP0661-20131031/41135_1 /ASSEMBLY_ACC=CAM_ASM_000606 /TAXON_ID=109239 /ORGANISM="Alexandrium margalefi, Strain AMGDE01CS-322" /LENGTH=126 /DNA_ID=CAMNT_0051583963 /DNA_START=55 /DNA_END=435 /DNA_ORIENTATION=-